LLFDAQLEECGPVLAPENSRRWPLDGFWNFPGPEKFQKPSFGHLLDFVGIILVAVYIIFGDSGANLDTWGTNLTTF